MASISTCFTITPKYNNNSIVFASKPSLRINFPQLNYCKSQFPKVRYSRAFVPLIRASIDVTAPDVKPGGIIESDKLPTDVRKRTMDAIDASGRRVTIGDVASKAGLKLNQAQKALQALAADASGFLEVSDEGDVLYVFPNDYRTKLAAKSIRLSIEPVLEKAKSVGEYVVRVSFGTALIASIVIVYTTIIAILSSRSDEDNRGNRRGRSYGSGFNFYLNPVDLFWYWDPNYNRRRQGREDEGMNFIESVFSFVFGDGDPNQGIEEERWKLIGQYIAANGGVVTAEELGPYLDVENAKKTNDDSYILPVLLRFDGQPEVDDEGNILYRFPSLQRTATKQRSGRKEYIDGGRKWSDWLGTFDRYFQERQLQFSKTKSSERALAVGLGGLNLFGVIVLGTMMNNMQLRSPSEFITFVKSIFPLLQVYAGSFFAIPLVRLYFVRKTNAERENRNKAREKFAKALESPDLSLRRKILSARDMAQRTFIGEDRIVYSTDKDFVEQDYEAKEWDKRFREVDKSD